MAKTYGLDSFGQIEGIRYTWNAEFPGNVKPFDGGSGTIKITRTWEWDPKTGTVSYEGKDKEGKPLKVTYQRSQLSSQSDAIGYCLMPAWTTQTRTIGFSAETRYPGTGKSPSHECLQNAARITF
jgi:hypothetical protein